MTDRTFRELRERRDPVEGENVAKKALSRIGATSEGQFLALYLRGEITSNPSGISHAELLLHEGRRQFAAELLQALENDYAPPSDTNDGTSD